MIAGRSFAVEPSNVYLPALHFAAIDQVQEERLVACPAFDDDDALLQRSLQARQGLLPVLAMGDNLCDHGVELRGNGVAQDHSCIHAHARPRRGPEAFNHARSRSKTVVGIFRVQTYFDCVTGAAWWLSFQATAARHMNLKLHQVESGGAFGHRMLDLQAGIYFHKPESVTLRFIQKLHGAGIRVARCLAQPNSSLAYRLIFFRRKSWRRRLFENFLLAALNGAIPHIPPPMWSRNDRR